MEKIYKKKCIVELIDVVLKFEKPISRVAGIDFDQREKKFDFCL